MPSPTPASPPKAWSLAELLRVTRLIEAGQTKAAPEPALRRA